MKPGKKRKKWEFLRVARRSSLTTKGKLGREHQLLQVQQKTDEVVRGNPAPKGDWRATGAIGAGGIALTPDERKDRPARNHTESGEKPGTATFRR